MENNKILKNLNIRFCRSWEWQEDNASPHRARYTQNYLATQVPAKLNWPARSPDLSPIEQIWDYLKMKLANMTFKSKEELFYALSHAWNEIPNNTINNYYTSFLARCTVCSRINGESLNGHRKQVKEIHNQYKIQLVVVRDPLLGLFQKIETPIH